ncbi:MAG: single-stranded-DNA-specific exonuclease RecJ [Defluviitaleaceae bacterium]|nr:single-stranded-DNA-specific exonuclease RecJ [Defluviitaleaceae bacterium]
MTTNRWVLQETDADLQLMSKVLGISPTMATVMANRGLRTKKTALNFLMPSLERMHDPMEMAGTGEAISLIKEAIQAGDKIVVYGDYDVDGITSTVILMKTLQAAGADVDYYIPHRIDEGYGLNIPAINTIHQAGAKLLITVDNGISAIEEVAAANALGLPVIIIDHHEPGFTQEGDTRTDILPAAKVVIDPKQSHCQYPYKELCAAGLSYKLAMAFGGLSQDQQDEVLALAAIGTICDIVDLQDENRTIVTEGLSRLNAHKLLNPGLGSLIAARGYLEKPIDTFAVGFILGPCLNATGRLGSASQAVQLLLAADSAEERIRLAQELCQLNDARKQLTADCVERAIADLPNPLDKVLVLTDNQAHESVAGIVAGRIKESTGRPTILLTQGDGAMKGSGRSVEGYNLFEALFAHKHLFIRFGGHPMAAGLTILEENIPLLKEALNADCNLAEDEFIPALKIDRELDVADIKLSLSEELAKLAPYGKGNREPLFVSRKLYVDSCRIINEKNTLIFTFSTTAGKLKGIAFGLNQAYAAAVTTAGVRPLGGYFMDIVYLLEVNVYNGMTSVQARLRDFRVVTQ